MKRLWLTVILGFPLYPLENRFCGRHPVIHETTGTAPQDDLPNTITTFTVLFSKLLF
jgi:hypothetical protein